MSSQEQRRIDFFDDIEGHITEILRRRKVCSDQAREVARETADFIALHWGGTVLSIPKGFARRREQRDAELLVKFNGANYASLAQEYDMTERGMRRAIDRAQAKAKERK